MPLLDIERLSVTYPGGKAAVQDVSLSVDKGECLAIIGESGSGKSQTFLAAAGLLGSNAAVDGSVTFDGVDGPNARQALGGKLTLVFQNALSVFTPHMTIGDHLMEALSYGAGLHGEPARSRAMESLALARFPDPKKTFAAFPHELSGGLRQRALMAIALAPDPELVVADEATAALDVTLAAELMSFVETDKLERGRTWVWITHDIHSARRLAERVAVLYAGQVVETGPAARVLGAPSHPYTQALIAATPNLDGPLLDRLPQLPGQFTAEIGPGCAFAARCPQMFDLCLSTPPPIAALGQSACHRVQL